MPRAWLDVRVLAGIAVIACAGTLFAQQATFRAGTEIVSLGVTVSDKKTNFLTDLTRDDLEIFEDGKKQTIEYFARGDQDAAPELHIGLLFDTSGSMDAVLTLVRASDVTVYSVGFLENQPGSVRAEQRLRLTQLASESGGEAFFPFAMKQIEGAYDKILMQIWGPYSFGYVSP